MLRFYRANNKASKRQNTLGLRKSFLGKTRYAEAGCERLARILPSQSSSAFLVGVVRLVGKPYTGTLRSVRAEALVRGG